MRPPCQIAVRPRPIARQRIGSRILPAYRVRYRPSDGVEKCFRSARAQVSDQTHAAAGNICNRPAKPIESVAHQSDLFRRIGEQLRAHPIDRRCVAPANQQPEVEWFRR